MSFRFKHGDRPLDGYTIQRGVGRGGFGEVYYAISDGGREVALKALLLNHEIELRGVSQCINLKNPHLVSIFDVRTTPDSMPFVIMEYVAGPSLRDILRERPQGLGRETAGYFLREIGKGLAYLHDRGIVHRDLKPENIFFEDGYVKIGDYGLSKYISVSRQSGQTMSVGTVHYMAPEIGTGIYNRGIDIYALGIILHELLTGRVPFGGDSFGEIIMKHLTAKPDLSGLDGSFAPVIGRALEKRPEDRYATVDAMVEDLFREPSLQASVSVFNPAHLTLAGRKHEPPRPVSPAAETVTFEADAIARAAAPNGRPAERAAPFLAAQDGDGPAVGLATPPHPGPGAGWQARLFGSPPPAKPPREARPEAAARPLVSPVAEPAPQNLPDQPPRPDVPDVALDPLDRSQRLARAAFAGGIVTLIAAVFREMNPAQTVGFAVLMAASAWAVILSQTTLARRFKLEPGPWRRILAAALIGLPALFIGSGSGFFGSRAPDRTVLVYLLGIVLVDWSLRIDARRDERISFGRAFAASLPAFLLSIFMDIGRSSIICGLLLAAVSLSVNALSPFVPHALRKRKPSPRETPAHAGVDLQHVAANLEREAAALRAQHARGERAAAGRAAKPPWHLRPVHPLLRFLDYFLGATGIGTTLVFLSLALFGDHARLEAYTGAVISGALGLFFFRRGLRPRRGKLWAEMLRPFLLIGSGATLAVCLPWIGYYTWYGDRNSEPLWALATVATVVGVLSYVLRPWSRRRTEPSVEAAGPPERKVHLGWAALGIMLWMAGLSSALLACAATIGLPQALDLEREIDLDERFIAFLPGAAWSITLNLVIAAAACVVVSRRQAGGGHLARAVAGQAALGCLLLLAFQLASLVHVGPGGVVEFWGDEDGLFVGALVMLGLAAGGVILLAWPLKRARPEPIPELSHA